MENNDEWLNNQIKTYINDNLSHKSLIILCENIYEKGFSGLDVIAWIKKTPTIDNKLKANTCVYFDTIRKEYRFEKMLIYTILDYLYLRSNKDLKNITEI